MTTDDLKRGVAREIFQPNSPECTTQNCETEIVRYIQYPNDGIVVGYCDECAETGLIPEGSTEVTDCVA